MKRLFILFIVTPVLLLIASGCISKQANDEPVNLEDQVKQELGVEVVVPEMKDLQIANAFVYFQGDDPAYVTVQYASNRGKINEYFRNEANELDEEILKEYEEEMNSKFLYGPYEGDLGFILTFWKGESSLDHEGEEMNIDGVPVWLLENESGHAITVEHEEGYYSLDYNSDTYSKEEALEETRDLIQKLN